MNLLASFPKVNNFFTATSFPCDFHLARYTDPNDPPPHLSKNSRSSKSIVTYSISTGLEHYKFLHVAIKRFVRVRSERELRPTRTADLHEVPPSPRWASGLSGSEIMSCMSCIFFEEENWVPVNFRGAIVARRFRNMASFVLFNTLTLLRVLLVQNQSKSCLWR